MSYFVGVAQALASFVSAAHGAVFKAPKPQCDSHVIEGLVDQIMQIQSQHGDKTRAAIMRSMVAMEPFKVKLMECLGHSYTPDAAVPQGYVAGMRQVVGAVASSVTGKTQVVSNVIHISEAKAFVAAEEAAKKLAQATGIKVTENATAEESLFSIFGRVVGAIDTRTAVLVGAGAAVAAVAAYAIYKLCREDKQKVA